MKPRKIRTLLVANRGEIALRVMRTCREMGIRTVAVYSDADAWAPHVQVADEAHRLGPPPAKESYLRGDLILEAAKKSGADAVHPGYGFLSENAEFGRMCAKAGVAFVGPRAESIDAIGNKVHARQLAKKAGVPTVPGLDRAIGPKDDAGAIAAGIGFPVLIKAAAGGGGRGMRVVREAKDVERNVREAGNEAAGAFGDGSVFLERYVERPRHIEIQVFGDSAGNVVHLNERECSIQRRHQKLIEEGPSPVVDAALRAEMGRTAIRLAKAVGYVSAGTLEFLLDAGGKFYFLEMNTRLQVEHPVTEMITGTDLVKAQILVAEGAKLPWTQDDLAPRGHAIEARITAEDPFANFAPGGGTILGLDAPSGPHTRWDCGVEAGGTISMFYDSMIAKLICWGRDRAEAIERLRRALSELVIVGVPTLVPFHLHLLADPRFRAGNFHTGFVENEFSMKGIDRPHLDEAAAIVAALEYRRRRQETPEAGPGPAAGPSPWKSQALREGLRG
ncbi:MAG: acetyl-CoA carboxylase biotin carboxylase subunit [Candidatus Brocadiae bacterium]|nr:acetyl-CoA carboxylase biotin carboxylase subunit [Candidatus Brocadiia bacterium]